ncbi:MAG: hypothetical protein H6545_06400 [Bacteroidales bacterium]|nr:hypothetical protein [Bacteroidales bacterium]
MGYWHWNWFLLFIRTVGGLRIWNLKRKGNPLFRKLHSTYGNLVRRVSSF